MSQSRSPAQQQRSARPGIGLIRCSYSVSTIRWNCRKREPAALLTPRNVQSFRTAFNVAHALYERLGPAGWRALLATVCTLDTVMAGPAGVALARPAHPAAVATSDRDADLAILEAAAAQLLHATADGTLQAALTVITALCDLSASTGILMQVRTTAAMHAECSHGRSLRLSLAD